MRNPLIQIENVSFGYEKNNLVLKNITLEIEKGEVVALVGQNGSGKTTLSKLFNGLIKPTKGRVLIDGLDTREKTVSELAQKVGYVFQNPDHQIFESTVYAEVAFGVRGKGMLKKKLQEVVEASLEKVELIQYKDVNPYSLSKGQRQRLAIASVIAMESEIIVLDEPTTGLDYREKIEIMELLKSLNSKGITIIFVTHDMNLVGSYAKRMVVVAEGEIIADSSPREVFGKEEVIKKAHLNFPAVTKLAQKINLSDTLPLNAEEFFKELVLKKERIKNGFCS